jgi:hypothetical protein
MGKKHSTPGEELLLLPTPPTALPVVDTHTHVASTFEFYRARYKDGKHTNVFDFVKGMYDGRNVEALLDVWCEAPVQRLWKEFADAAVEESVLVRFGCANFLIQSGVFMLMKFDRCASVSLILVLRLDSSLINATRSHDAKKYDDNVEKDM